MLEAERVVGRKIPIGEMDPRIKSEDDDAARGAAPYSTVTDFARLRG